MVPNTGLIGSAPVPLIIKNFNEMSPGAKIKTLIWLPKPPRESASLSEWQAYGKKIRELQKEFSFEKWFKELDKRAYNIMKKDVGFISGAFLYKECWRECYYNGLSVEEVLRRYFNFLNLS